HRGHDDGRRCRLGLRRLAEEPEQVVYAVAAPARAARPAEPRFWHPAVFAVLGVYVALAACTALFEFKWSVEAWFASPALTLLDKGYLGTTILESKGTWLEGVDRHTYWISPLYPLLQALWYKLFGFSLWALRSLSIVAGAAVLLAWCRIVHLLTGK